MEACDGRRVGGDGAGPTGGEQDGDEEQPGPAELRESQRMSIHHGGVTPKRAVTSWRSLVASFSLHALFNGLSTLLMLAALSSGDTLAKKPAPVATSVSSVFAVSGNSTVERPVT